MVKGMQHVGKQLAVVLWAKNAAGEEEAVTFSGGIIYDGEQFLVDRGTVNKPFPLTEDWVSQIRPMAEELEGIFPDCDVILQLAVGDLPGDVDEALLKESGVTWPTGE